MARGTTTITISGTARVTSDSDSPLPVGHPAPGSYQAAATLELPDSPSQTDLGQAAATPRVPRGSVPSGAKRRLWSSRMRSGKKQGSSSETDDPTHEQTEGGGDNRRGFAGRLIRRVTAAGPSSSASESDEPSHVG